jgi:hypothetical protein
VQKWERVAEHGQAWFTQGLHVRGPEELALKEAVEHVEVS